MSLPPIQIFGEALFDHFPDGRRVLGGAPFNVAWHLQAFGAAPCLIGAVGDDPDGRAIRAAMADWGLRLDGLGTDPAHGTGQVAVSFDQGEPVYDILPDRAYDHIRLPEPRPARNPGPVPQVAGTGGGLLYHGTLALRQAVSAATLERLRAECRRRGGLILLDVNLRAPWWSRETVWRLLDAADWAKLNRDELLALAAPERPTATEAADSPVPASGRTTDRAAGTAAGAATGTAASATAGTLARAAASSTAGPHSANGRPPIGRIEDHGAPTAMEYAASGPSHASGYVPAEDPALERLRTLARGLLERHRLRGLVLTLGADGALAFAADGCEARVVPEPAGELLDTVGAGDAFTAVLILGLRRDWPLPLILERAQSFASRILGQRGATAADPALYAPFAARWGLDAS